MLARHEIKHLHLELSSFCNARCPRCPRNFYGFPHVWGFEEHNLPLTKLQSLLSLDVVENLEEILINGNFGDFVMNPESLDIIRWFRDINLSLAIRISTNGGARDKKFWQDLAQLDVDVEFCIDGLADTHAIYRQDTSYDVVVKNAKNFIDAGGRAIWLMTEFQHNLHQFDQAESLSKQLGFTDFRRRKTKRDTGPVYDRRGHKIYSLKNQDFGFRDNIDIKYADLQRDIQNRDHDHIAVDKKQISCQAQNQRSIYISARGQIVPCCFMALYPLQRAFYSGLPELLEEHSLERSLELFADIEKTFYGEGQLKVCQNYCSHDNNH